MVVTNEQQFDPLKSEVGQLTINLHNLIEEMRSSVREFDDKVKSFATRMEQCFDWVEKRFGEMDNHFDRLKTEMEPVDTRFNRSHKEVKSMPIDVISRTDILAGEDQVTDRLARTVEDRVISLERRVDMLEERY